MLCTFYGLTNHTVDNCYEKNGFKLGILLLIIVRLIWLILFQNLLVQFLLPQLGLLPTPIMSSSNSQQQEQSLPTPTAQIHSIDANMSSLAVKGTLSTWIIDTIAIDHVTCSLDQFTNMKHVNNHFATLPNKCVVQVIHVGTIALTSSSVLYDVLFIPTFSYNLVTAIKLTANSSYFLTFHASNCMIQDLHSMMICEAKQHHGLHHLLLHLIKLLFILFFLQRNLISGILDQGIPHKNICI